MSMPSWLCLRRQLGERAAADNLLTEPHLDQPGGRHGLDLREIGVPSLVWRAAWRIATGDVAAALGCRRCTSCAACFKVSLNW
jgi:hypothetical protein